MITRDSDVTGSRVFVGFFRAKGSTARTVARHHIITRDHFNRTRPLCGREFKRSIHNPANFTQRAIDRLDVCDQCYKSLERTPAVSVAIRLGGLIAPYVR